MTDAPIPYGRQWIEDDDVQAVVESLRGDWLTQGPRVEAFEQALCAATGARHAVAVSSGTAALHLAVLALGLRPGEYGVTSAITFVASANCIAYAGGRVRFADVTPETGLLDVASLEAEVRALVHAGTPPRVLIPVDLCGQCADLPAVRRVAEACGAKVIEDAAHALGATYAHEGRLFRAGSCVHTDLSILSFHPVKHVTTGEGGAVLTNDEHLCARVRELRSHGIHRDPARLARPDEGPWYYEQDALGYNYRLTDVQCALGLSQLAKLERFVARRNEIAARYDGALAAPPLARHLAPLRQAPGGRNAYHLYVVCVAARPGDDLRAVAARRKGLYLFLRERGIFTQVHYIPVPWQPYYRECHATRPGDYPGAAAYYAGCLSLPMFPRLSSGDQDRVLAALCDWAGAQP